MKRIPIKVKSRNEEHFHNAEVLGVMPTMRIMAEGDIYLFPYDYREAVRTATCILRKDGYPVFANVTKLDNVKYLKVEIHEQVN